MRHAFKCLCFSVMLLGCGTVLAPLHPAHAAPPPSDSSTDRAVMPVRMVVLFSSGVGYFEHGGTVQGNSFTELRFKSAQINDILKSLVLEDLDGGKIGAITYPSRDPVEKTLRSFQVDITSNPSLAELLNQLRGAPVRVTVHAEQVEGTILGLEKRRRTLPGQTVQVVEEWMFNILSGEAMRSVWLDEVGKVEIRDVELEQEIHKALAALAEARNQDKKPVVINFQGDGNRRVRLRYVIETPIWKTSYRLILPQETAPQSKLQGWAIIENQTDADWTDVRLSLVSGRPVSFVEDLYKPVYVSRLVVEPELYANLRPRSYEGGITAPAPPAAPKREAAAGAMKGMSRETEALADRSDSVFLKHMEVGPEVGPEEEEEEEAFDATASIAAAASAEQLGELFQYTVGSVSLPRNRSAMFPILAEDIAAERVSIFNSEVMPANPLRGVLLRNSTDKHIMQGPVTVFEGDTYAGDARIGNLPPGQDRLLSYALDLEVQVDAAKNRRESAIQTASIVKGVLNVSRKDVFSREYTIQNKSGGERTLVIEHRFRQGWKLVSPQPIETTGAHYRLKQTVPSGKTETMTVVEEIVRGETIAILPGEIGPLDIYSRSGQIPKNVRDILGKAIELKRAVVDTERLIQEKREALEEIDKEQNRIRSNMSTVNSSSQYYARLLEKLNGQETTIEAIQSELNELEKKLEEQRQELESYLGNLSVG